MLTNVHLYGDLKRYGECLELDITTPGEAIKAISSWRPEFLQDLGDEKYIIMVGHDHVPLPLVNLSMPFGGEDLHFVPIAEGEDPATVGFITSAYIGSVIGYTAAFWVGYALATVAIYMVMTGIANLLFPAPKISEIDNDETPPSYSFNGILNTTRQGNPVPLCYGGPVLVGGQLISFQVAAEDLA